MLSCLMWSAKSDNLLSCRTWSDNSDVAFVTDGTVTDAVIYVQPDYFTDFFVTDHSKILNLKLHVISRHLAMMPVITV